MAIPKGLSFDELNQLYSEEHEDDLRSMPYEQYFGEMTLTQEQKDERTRTAGKIENFTLIALASLYYMMQDGGFDYGSVSAEMISAYRDLMEDLDVPFTDAFQSTHPENVVYEIIFATLMNQDDPYFFSYDRAMLIAENESNSIWNDSDFQEAVLSGKRWKTWIAILDKRTRDTHRAVDGARIPIDEYFQVGEALLMYPRADSSFPEEVINCRCSVSYS